MSKIMQPSEIEDLLSKKFYGHLGCSNAHEVYVAPITYVYADEVVYGYTHEGKKIEMMRANPNVCLQVEEVKSGHQWKSVVCNGTYEEITDPKEIHDVSMLMAERFAQIRKHDVYDPYFLVIQELHEHEIKTPTAILYRIRIARKSGRKET